MPGPRDISGWSILCSLVRQGAGPSSRKSTIPVREYVYEKGFVSVVSARKQKFLATREILNLTKNRSCLVAQWNEWGESNKQGSLGDNNGERIMQLTR